MRYQTLTPWLTKIEIKNWMHTAHTKNEYERRLAIWLSVLDYAPGQISEMLAVSIPTVRRWLQIYNKKGPAGIIVKARGGRRHALLTLEQEKQLLQQWPKNKECNAKEIQQAINRMVGKKVSLKYAYSLIHRHDVL